MVNKPNKIIFDSSGLVSLVKSDDQLHEEAVRLAKILIKNDWQVLLPYEILAETLNSLGKLVNKRSAITVGEALMVQYATQEIVFVQSEPHIVERAIEYVKSAPGAPSFIDCMVMAHADEQQTKYIFGFDATFRKNGYKLPV